MKVKGKNIICIYSTNINNKVSVYSDIPFFKNNDNVEILLNIEKIIIKEIGIDYVGKTYVINNKKLNIYAEIKPGHYPIDEDESNDNQIVFYFEDRIEDNLD